MQKNDQFLDFYVSQAIYGYIVWAWKEPLTPTQGEFYADKECMIKFVKKRKKSAIHHSAVD